MDESRRCTARSRTGERCQKAAIIGGRVCASHGGSAPQVRDAARRRLLEAVDPVAAELIRLALESPDERVRLAACRDVLDRAGIREPLQIDAAALPAPALVEEWIAALEAELAAEAERLDGTD